MESESTLLFHPTIAINQRFKSFADSGIIIDIKREDLLHPQMSGNKLRKLKYNLKEAQDHGTKTILTYGGAFSNHIAATAAACNILGLKSIGVIRGEELGVDLEKTLNQNKTLRTAHNYGMKLVFVTREKYKLKDTAASLREYHRQFGKFYNIPEGGTNELAIKGTQEILTDFDLENYDVICVAAGTGGTAAGIINSAGLDQKIIVFSALKGDFLKDEIQKYTTRTDFTLVSEDYFGGYARSSNELINYMNNSFRESGIPLEPIYTGKMMYGLEQMVEVGAFNSKTRILAVHTGGLQGIAGYNKRLIKKGLPYLQYEDDI
ncbi:1-aminocyclopropane-1-carboxylate deaminase/D-cysteine desulfhydrase [Nonlabens antarcticus]|uniref:1-aminocyclopropane-1-carboxylate deaminase/D-cysteine desulfhydrase n=1 Tax=Nonlabens antarcticus TaxID=392714 RepID=UPI0018910D18|nr:pyridoxal-phosphate dependent enzyme [Nonlabens antarcticus]